MIITPFAALQMAACLQWHLHEVSQAGRGGSAISAGAVGSLSPLNCPCPSLIEQKACLYNMQAQWKLTLLGCNHLNCIRQSSCSCHCMQAQWEADFAGLL